MGRTYSNHTKGDYIFDIVNTTLLILVLLIVLYPLIFVVSASFSDPLEILDGKVWLLPKGFTLEGYKRVFSNNDIMTGYKNTIIYTLLGTFVNLVMTIAGAYPLSRKDFYGRNIIMLLFTFTMFFSGGLIPTYLIIRKLNMVNKIWVLVLPGAVSMYNLIITKTFFQSTIPLELQEAAVIDGCSNIKILLKIVLPLSIPIIAVMTIFYGVAHWNAFFDALIYITDRKKFPLQLILREILIQNQMDEMMNSDIENLAQQMMMAEVIKYAVVIVASVPVLMLYPFLQKYFVKGVMIGAIKG
ncbi:MAG TPA: carbohydrate ABC transporter permease [Clostridiales bacterium]|nr:carbohydrate ABC transporter permease [Clostridiales bacterium]